MQFDPSLRSKLLSSSEEDLGKDGLLRPTTREKKLSVNNSYGSDLTRPGNQLDGSAIRIVRRPRRLADGNRPALLDKGGVRVIAGENEGGQVLHKTLKGAGATVQLPKRAPHRFHWVPKSTAAHLNTSAVAAGGAVDLLALPVKLRQTQLGRRSWRAGSRQKARYRDRAQRWQVEARGLRADIRNLTRRISDLRNQSPLDHRIGPLESELENKQRQLLGLAEGRYRYDAGAARAGRGREQTFKHLVGSFKSAGGVTRAGLLLAGKTAAAGGGFITVGALGVIGGAITAGVGIMDVHQDRKGLQRANRALEAAQALRDGAEANKAREDLVAIAEGARSKRKGGIFNNLMKVFMGTTSMAGGGVSIGLGVAVGGFAAASIATFGIAAAVVGGIAILGAIGLAAYKHFAVNKPAKAARAAAAEVQRLADEIRKTERQIRQVRQNPELGDIGDLVNQKLQLETDLRNAQLTLYRLDPDAAVRRLAELMEHDDGAIRQVARTVAAQLIGDDTDKRNLFADLVTTGDRGAREPAALELLQAQAYGV